MKRAKIALVAIALFAVAGGAVAFKAKRGAIIYTTTAPGLRATSTVFDATLTTTGTAYTYATTIYNSTAPSTYTVALF